MHDHLTDVDECSEQTDECQQICNNTIGSYVCDCRIGYALNTDGRTCRGECVAPAHATYVTP